jgi:AhpD family alkylhydroperoxidase
MSGVVATANPRAFGGFRKRTQRLGQWLAGLFWILARWRDVRAVAVKHRMDPALQEAVKVAVAHVNACRVCSYVHQTEALRVGLTAEDVELITAGSPALGDAHPQLAAATAYAQARAEDGFGPVPDALRDRLVEVFGVRSADDVELVARLMHQANMVMNAFEALRARARGQTPSGSRLVDDLALGSFALSLMIVGVPVLALAWRRSPITVFRELFGFTPTHASGARGASR